MDPTDFSEDDIQKLIAAGVAPAKIKMLQAQQAQHQALGSDVGNAQNMYANGPGNNAMVVGPSPLAAIAKIGLSAYGGYKSRQDSAAMDNLQSQVEDARNIYANHLLGNTRAGQLSKQISQQTAGAADDPMGADMGSLSPDMPTLPGGTGASDLIQNALQASLRRKPKSAAVNSQLAGTVFDNGDQNGGQ